MISVAANTQQQLKDIIQAAFDAAREAGEIPDSPPAEFTVEVPADTAKGDFATNAAMVNARTFRMAPQKLAAILVARMDLSALPVDRCQVAGPGFINFFVTPGWYVDQVKDILEKGPDYGRSSYGGGQKVMVEFVSANPTGPSGTTPKPTPKPTGTA